MGFLSNSRSEPFNRLVYLLFWLFRLDLLYYLVYIVDRLDFI